MTLTWGMKDTTTLNLIIIHGLGRQEQIQTRLLLEGRECGTCYRGRSTTYAVAVLRAPCLLRKAGAHLPGLNNNTLMTKALAIQAHQKVVHVMGDVWGASLMHRTLDLNHV